MESGNRFHRMSSSSENFIDCSKELSRIRIIVIPMLERYAYTHQILIPSWDGMRSHTPCKYLIHMLAGMTHVHMPCVYLATLQVCNENGHSTS